jgi:hypothetical protein
VHDAVNLVELTLGLSCARRLGLVEEKLITVGAIVNRGPRFSDRISRACIRMQSRAEAEPSLAFGDLPEGGRTIKSQIAAALHVRCMRLSP